MKTTKVTRSFVVNGLAATVDVTVIQPLAGNIILVAEPRTDSFYPEHRDGSTSIIREAQTLTLMPDPSPQELLFAVLDEVHPFVFTDLPFMASPFANSPAEWTRTMRALAERFASMVAVYTVELLEPPRSQPARGPRAMR